MVLPLLFERDHCPSAATGTLRLLAQLGFLISLLIGTTIARAENAFGVVELVDGKVSIIDVKGQTRIVHVNDRLAEGETIVTGRDGELHVRTEDHGYIAYRPNSKVIVQSYRAEGDKDDGMVLSIVYGALRSVTGWIGKVSPKNYAIKTPVATVGIRGTDHEPLHIPLPGPGEKTAGEPGTYEKVNAGRTSLQNAAGETIVNAGQVAFASHDPKKPPKNVDHAPDAYRTTANESKIDARKAELAKEVEKRLEEKQKAKVAKEEAEKKGASAKKKHKPLSTK